jgi:hypothetical protein
MTDFSDVRIFLCTIPTNMNYSFDRLMGRAQEVFEQDPTSGHLFLFWNKGRDRMKILFWDRDGFCIWYKNLETHYPHFFLFTEFCEFTNNCRRWLTGASAMVRGSTRTGPRRRPMSQELATTVPPRAEIAAVP